jgi:putative intracellular protease/amidase
MKSKGKIAVLIEGHFDPTEPNAFTMFFPANGYQVEFVSNLRGLPSADFRGTDTEQVIHVDKDIRSVDLTKYRGLFLVGGYAMDMLRYEVHVEQNSEPAATSFVRKAMGTPDLLIGTICHSLWILTPAPDLLKGRHVTCGHNVMYDVQNAGAILVYDEHRHTLADTHVDGNLITARHPYVVAAFMNVFLDELEKRREEAPAKAGGVAKS